MKKFNKKLRLFITISLCLTIMAGCSNSNKSLNDASKDSQTNNETSNKPDQSKSDKNKTINNNETENNENSLLKNIKTLAEEGKIINSDFADNSFNISDVEGKLGKADKSEWVSGAKGFYSTYLKYNVVFGSNKGGRIFEVRSFDSRLKDITLSKFQ